MAVSAPPRQEDLDKCVHCGLCLNACPTYRELGVEMDSPRGRIYQMVQVANGAPITEAYQEHIDLCLGCRGCETACPSGVHYGRLIEGARSFVERNHSRSFVDRLKRSAVSAIFPYPNRLRAVLAPLALVDRLSLRAVLRAIMPPGMRGWLDLLPPPDRDSRPLAREATVAPRADAPT